MDYYEEPRQYDALMQDAIKYPTKTNLVPVENGKDGKLRFTNSREHADIDVS